MDSVSWVALGSALTLAGLLVSVLVWSRRGAGPGLRAVAWSLLPLAAALTGILRLAGDVVDAVGRWAVRLVLSPVVWLGVVVAGLAVVLWLVGTVVSARTQPKAVGSAPARPRGQAPVASGRGGVVEDQDDIEAILRKHGIR
ncbi:hypothetical protein [Nocardioides marmoribigeumensis]|jgi:hypothetical protein|uniref:Cellulose synthase n=1 Tax=Nocardioides marmoribigeumensis TaxID=433649 RepID=A0ABU2BQS4_9ACTN|nr:hypothetical protein [Nocardioides marmoribigeumensis]MDR7360969.1 hypothetical protein [Nocardioides marmoribigeumensis]